MSSIDFKKINMDGGQIQIMQQKKATFANTEVSYTFVQSIFVCRLLPCTENASMKNESYTV